MPGPTHTVATAQCALVASGRAPCYCYAPGAQPIPHNTPQLAGPPAVACNTTGHSKVELGGLIPFGSGSSGRRPNCVTCSDLNASNRRRGAEYCAYRYALQRAESLGGAARTLKQPTSQIFHSRPLLKIGAKRNEGKRQSARAEAKMPRIIDSADLAR